MDEIKKLEELLQERQQRIEELEKQLFGLCLEIAKLVESFPESIMMGMIRAELLKPILDKALEAINTKRNELEAKDSNGTA